MSLENDVYPFQRVQSPSGKKRPGRKKGRRAGFPRRPVKMIRDWKWPAFALLGFFLGRVVLLGEMSPCAAAFMAAGTRVFPELAVPALLGVCAGLVTISRGVQLAGALVTVFLTCLLVYRLPAGTARPWLVVPGTVLSLTLIVKTCALIVGTPTAYDYIGVAFEAVFAAGLTLAFLQGLPLLNGLSPAHNPTGEELFCLSVLFAAVIAGTGDLHWGVVSLKGLLTRLVILLAALTGGAGPGAAAGAVVGILPGLVYTAVPAMVGAFSFTGLLAGLGRGFGKIGTATGLLLGNIILSVYLNNFGGLAGVTLETGLAVLLFMLIPTEHIARLCTSLSPALSPAPNPFREAGVRASLAGRMRHWSRIFQEISRSFEQTAVAPAEKTETGLQPLFNEIGGRVCEGCGMYRTCWEREFYQTYQALLELFSLVETSGRVEERDLPAILQRRCSRPKEMAITVNCLFDLYRLNQFWAKRLGESRQIVSEQLRGVCEIIDNLSSELESGAPPAGAEETALRQKLKQNGVPVLEVGISRGHNDGREVVLTRQACAAGDECRLRVMPLISRFFGERYELPFSDCAGCREGDLCRIRLYPGLPFRLHVGTAVQAGNGVCGDSYAVFPLRGGRAVLVLSDGMGVGAQAARESKTAVSLLAHLLDSGLDHHLAVKTVNSMMILRAAGETFATLDLAILDLYRGEGEFIKIGAPSAYLVRGRRVFVLQASSLPVGIIKDIEVASISRKLRPGDVLVMLSDGVLDACRGEKDREDWVCGVLREIGDLPPEETAELLLKLARTGAGEDGRSADDMTVLVARLEKVHGREEGAAQSGA